MVSELNDNRQSLRNAATRLGSVSLESCRPNTLGTHGVRDRQDPRPTLADVTAHACIVDTQRGSIGAHGVNPIPRALLFHDGECSAGKLVALNIPITHISARNLLRSALRRHVVMARRTKKDTTITPEHVPIDHLVNGRHLASPLGIEEHDPAVIVRFILGHRRPAAPDPQRDHRIARRQKTDGPSAHTAMKHTAPREHSNREHDDEERPSAGSPRPRRTTVRFPIGTRLVLLSETIPHARYPSRRGSGRGHAHPRV